MQAVGKTDKQTDLSPEIILYTKNEIFNFLLEILDDLRLLREFLQSDKTDLADYQIIITSQKIFDFLSLF